MPLSYRLSHESFNPSDFLAQSGGAMMGVLTKNKLPPHSSHPDFGHLTLLVLEAVMEVVFISLPGYITARMGNFNAEQQKFLANLNVQLFTPALIFTKLASQLTAEKLAELAIIPIIFVVQTLVSWLCAQIMSRVFRFPKRARYFVTAMAVFGNSNSLPISLVLSLSMTLKGLHWDRIPKDNDNEVAARGILYLLIFQQLGQVVRWSWGYNSLLAKPDTFTIEEGGTRPDHDLEPGDFIDSALPAEEDDEIGHTGFKPNNSFIFPTNLSHSDYESGTVSPINYDASPASSEEVSSAEDSDADDVLARHSQEERRPLLATPANGNHLGGRGTNGHIVSFPSFGSPSPDSTAEQHSFKAKCSRWFGQVKARFFGLLRAISQKISAVSGKVFASFPQPMQKVLAKIGNWISRFMSGLWQQMNPPLWAMLFAIIVASVPPLQDLFFNKGTFVNNSITRAVSQSGGVAVPLILVVLGANLARNTLPKEARETSEDPKFERNLLIASMVSRMVLPLVIMAPILAITAKFVPVSILDDPIFLIVCFLLTGAPSALQLAQICQLNDVYMGVVSKLLFQSYVVWILPSTLILVMIALETLEWAKLS